MTLSEFEDRYRLNPDPWSYGTSRYERGKYDATLRACGPWRSTEALELGSSIGVFSERLADRCRRLTTIDGAPTAVRSARRRLGGRDEVDVVLGPIPDAIPIRPYDLVVASEILYYFTPEVLTATLDRIRALTRRSARLIAVHWRPTGAERPLTAEQVHQTLHDQPWLERVSSQPASEYLLDVFVVR